MIGRRSQQDYDFDCDYTDQHLDDCITGSPLGPNGNLPAADDSRLGGIGPVGPISHRLQGYRQPPPLPKRRALCDVNGYSPYAAASYDTQNSGFPSWYENTDAQIASLVETQKKVVNMVEKVSERISDIEKAVESLKAKCTSQSSSSASPEGKKRIPSDISKTVALIHKSLGEAQQFRPQLGSRDEHNKSVKKAIEEEISAKEGSSFSKLLIDRAIQRYFETCRRNWRESDPAQHDRVANQAKNRRIRARRLRLFERRQKAVHEGQEMEKYKQLTIEFMSAESSSDELGNPIVVHKPEWRSDKLVKFLEELDKRVTEANKENKKHIPERKERVDGSVLQSSPPSDAPKWTIDKNWQQEHLR